MKQRKPNEDEAFWCMYCKQRQISQTFPSPPTGKLKRTPTEAAKTTLKALARQKKRAGQIALVLKRTEGAVRQRASGLGISLNSRG